MVVAQLVMCRSANMHEMRAFGGAGTLAHCHTSTTQQSISGEAFAPCGSCTAWFEFARAPARCPWQGFEVGRAQAIDGSWPDTCDRLARAQVQRHVTGMLESLLVDENCARSVQASAEAGAHVAFVLGVQQGASLQLLHAVPCSGALSTHVLTHTRQPFLQCDLSACTWVAVRRAWQLAIERI